MTPKRFAELICWDNTVELVGFPDDINASVHMLETIKAAVHAAHVKPVEEGVWRGHEIDRRGVFQFDYLGFRYELEGEYKNSCIHVEFLEKIARVDEPCELSDTFGDHMPIIVEDYRMQRRQQESPEYGTW